MEDKVRIDLTSQSRHCDRQCSYALQTHRYDALFARIEMGMGKLAPEKLIGRTNPLKQSMEALVNILKFESAGVTVVTEF